MSRVISGTQPAGVSGEVPMKSLSVTPTTVNVSPRSFSVRPATAGSELKCLRQNHSLRTITGGAPGLSDSPSEKVRPSVSFAPSTLK
jgi:hypothetical protein